MRTPKTDFANFLTLLLTVDGPHTIPLHSWMYRDFLPVVSNSIPLPQELRIEGEIHEVPSPRPELESRVPKPLFQSASSKAWSGWGQPQHPRTEYSTSCLPPLSSSYPRNLALSLVGVVVRVGQISKVIVTSGIKERGQGSI